MKPEWKAFLENTGAEFVDTIVGTFGNPVRETRMVYTGDVLAVMSHYGLIAVTGEDATEFLQGQLTNDVRHVDAEHSQLSAVCNPKGRVIANFRIFRSGDTLYLRLPFDMVEDVIKRLKMFVLRSQVNIENATGRFATLGFSGPRAIDELGNAGVPVPANVDEVTHTDDLNIIRIHGPHPRFEVYGELDAMKNLWTRLDVRAAPVGTTSWQLLDILAGVPTIRPETGEQFVPQMINLQLINGVNFKKGCYTGQEIVARMQYLGTLKKRMYRAQLKTDDKPFPGDKLYSPGSEQSCGAIVNSQPSAEGGYEVLAVVDNKSYDSDNVHWKSAEGPALRFVELPYEFDAAAADEQSTDPA